MSLTGDNPWLSSSVTNDYLNTLLKKKFNITTFLGVFPCDIFPLEINEGESIILNTDPHHLPGKHYICLYRKNSRYFYFDSLAVNRKLAFKTLTENFKKRKISPIINVLTQPIQHFSSKFCGFFCVDYILAISEEFKNVKRVSYFCEKTKLQQNDVICFKNIIACINK